LCSQTIRHKRADIAAHLRSYCADAISDLHRADYSLAIKAGVHFTLCGGTVMKLGTAKHHQKYVDKMDSLELPGCFGMTELGHGSNVMVRHGPVNMKRCKSKFVPLSSVEAWQAKRC
jgi:hypothetical protein